MPTHTHIRLMYTHVQCKQTQMHIHVQPHVLIYIQGCTHRADLFAVTVVMKVVAVEAHEGAIYCVFFHGWVPQEGKNKLNAWFVPLARRVHLKSNSSGER